MIYYHPLFLATEQDTSRDALAAFFMPVNNTYKLLEIVSNSVIV